MYPAFMKLTFGATSSQYESGLRSFEGTFVQNVRNSPQKMGEVKLLRFNKGYHTFLSNPVKTNKTLHVSFEIMEL